MNDKITIILSLAMLVGIIAICILIYDMALTAETSRPICNHREYVVINSDTLEVIVLPKDETLYFKPK